MADASVPKVFNKRTRIPIWFIFPSLRVSPRGLLERDRGVQRHHWLHRRPQKKPEEGFRYWGFTVCGTTADEEVHGGR